MVKKRTIQQQSEKESEGAFMALFKDWIVNPLHNDFGFDFEVRLTNPLDEKTQEVSEISFYVQNKSSIRSPDDRAVEDLDIDNWILFLGQRIPVLIVKYDTIRKFFYWEITQDYLWDIIEREDPNWRSQITKRIALTKRIQDLDEIKSAIIDSQKRITRYHSLNLGIGEGIRIDKASMEYVSKTTDKFLDEYKGMSLQEAYLAKKEGHKEKSWKSLENVYKSPKNDEAKVKAIIGMTYALQVADAKQNRQIVRLADEGIALSESLGLRHFKDFITMIRDQAIMFMIIKKMSEIQVSLRIQRAGGENIFSYFYNKEMVKLIQFHTRLIQEINDSLVSLLKRKEIYYYVASLPILIDIATVQIMLFAAFDRRVIEEEKTGRSGFIAQCEFILENKPGADLETMLLRSLANYYYWTLNQAKAIDYMSKAIELARKDDDKHFVEHESELLEQYKSKTDPYAVGEPKDVEDMTSEEYQDKTEELLKAQGVDMKREDDISSAIKIALSDINPESKFRHCENIRIAYLGTSPLGASIGLPSMGSKLVWCKYCKGCSSGFSLDLIFESFIEENCKGCKHLTPRPGDWVCTVKFVMDQEKDAEFHKIVENVRKHFS